MACHFCWNIFSILLVPFMTGICCLGQEYKIDVEFSPIVFGDDNFSNISSPEYIELQGYVKDGLLLIAPNLTISGDVNITLEEEKMKDSQFHVLAEPEIVADFLYKLMVSERLVINNRSTPVTSLTCTGGVTDFKYPPQNYSHECEIRELLSPCLKNQTCHSEKDDQWLSCVAEIHKLAKEYVISVEFPIIVFDDDIFSNPSSPEYIKLQGYVKEGLLLIAPELYISGDVNTTQEKNGMKRSEFHVLAKPENVAEFLYKLMFTGLIINNQSTLVTSLTCTGGDTDLKYPDLSTNYTDACEIRERLSPCLENQTCHREEDDLWLSCVDTVDIPVTVTEIPVEIHERDENVVIVLACGAAVFALMLIFLVVFCWRKGCANSRKQRELVAMDNAVYRPEDLTMM